MPHKARFVTTRPVSLRGKMCFFFRAKPLPMRRRFAPSRGQERLRHNTRLPFRALLFHAFITRPPRPQHSHTRPAFLTPLGSSLKARFPSARHPQAPLPSSTSHPQSRPEREASLVGIGNGSCVDEGGLVPHSYSCRKRYLSSWLCEQGKLVFEGSGFCGRGKGLVGEKLAPCEQGKLVCEGSGPCG